MDRLKGETKKKAEWDCKISSDSDSDEEEEKKETNITMHQIIDLKDKYILLFHNSLSDLVLKNITSSDVTVSFSWPLPPVLELDQGEEFVVAYHRQTNFLSGQTKKEITYVISFLQEIETSMSLHKKKKKAGWIVYGLKKKRDTINEF